MMEDSLILDTTSTNLFVGLIHNGKRYCKLAPGLKFHNTHIMDMIDCVIKEAGITVNDLKIVGAVTGPGSYTGIRLGVTIANALGYAGKLNRVAISSLACVTPLTGNNYSVGIFAREGNYYYADFSDGKIVSEGDIDQDKIITKQPFIIQKEYDPSLVLDEFERKVNNKEFVPTLFPHYLKKAQAERLKGKK